MDKKELCQIAQRQLSLTFNRFHQHNFQSELISGKVRDCLSDGKTRTLIASDRLSAFDKHITTIPFKGQILNQMALYWFKKTQDIVSNHVIESPHPYVIKCKEVKIVPIEVVIRGYLTGSAWRDYEAGKSVSGVKLEPGLKQYGKFNHPILTPSTKAQQGDHDEPISEKEILDQKIVSPDLWQQIKETSLRLFSFGQQKANERGLILVDTKYEFGTITNKDGDQTLILADEVHTQDSSRYWIAKSYEKTLNEGLPPTMLDKEFVRSKLIELGFMGEGEVPKLTDEFRIETSLKYIEAYEQMTGEEFIPLEGDIEQQILTVI